MLRAEYPNYHPLVSIARIAHRPEADLDLQFKCHSTIAKYIESELRSVEVKADIRESHTVKVSLFDVEDVQVKGPTDAVLIPDSPQISLSNW